MSNQTIETNFTLVKILLPIKQVTKNKKVAVLPTPFSKGILGIEIPAELKNLDQVNVSFYKINDHIKIKSMQFLEEHQANLLMLTSIEVSENKTLEITPKFFHDNSFLVGIVIQLHCSICDEYENITQNSDYKFASKEFVETQVVSNALIEDWFIGSDFIICGKHIIKTEGEK